jgi:hypothetical protein
MKNLDAIRRDGILGGMSRGMVGLILGLFVLLSVVVWGACLGAPDPPRVTTAGGAFTVDGRPRFLMLVSYFDALRASDAAIETDFAFFAAHGIDGVRIFPNWWRCEAMRACGGHFGADTLAAAPDGRLRPDRLARLQQVLARAAAHRLVVDLSFARETVAPGPDGRPLSPEAHAAAIRATLDALRDTAPHVFVDLQNEVDHNRLYADDAAIDAQAVGRLRRQLATYRPPIFVSTGEADAEAYAYCGTPSRCPSDAQRLDVVGIHDTRRDDWVARTSAVVHALRAITSRRGELPIYFQEPFAWQDETASDRTERFLSAAAAAKASGAAAWTFHTRSAFILRDGRAMTARIDSDERAVLEQLRTRLERQLKAPK